MDIKLNRSYETIREQFLIGRPIYISVEPLSPVGNPNQIFYLGGIVSGVGQQLENDTVVYFVNLSIDSTHNFVFTTHDIEAEPVYLSAPYVPAIIGNNSENESNENSGDDSGDSGELMV